MFRTTEYTAHWLRLDEYQGRVMVDLTEDERCECIAVIDHYGTGFDQTSTWTEEDRIIFNAMKFYLHYH